MTQRCLLDVQPDRGEHSFTIDWDKPSVVSLREVDGSALGATCNPVGGQPPRNQPPPRGAERRRRGNHGAPRTASRCVCNDTRRIELVDVAVGLRCQQRSGVSREVASERRAARTWSTTAVHAFCRVAIVRAFLLPDGACRLAGLMRSGRWIAGRAKR